LFNSFETLEEERRAAKKQREETRDRLTSEQAALNTELANLKGMFTGKRRKEIEVRLAEIDIELKNL